MFVVKPNLLSGSSKEVMENKRARRKIWMRENCELVERTSNGQSAVLSYRWWFECSIGSEAFLRCLCDTPRSSPLTDAISHTGSEATRFQSRHCCEDNSSGLSHKSAPPCALQANTYIYTLSKRTPHVHTHKTKPCWILSSLLPEPKRNPFFSFSLFFFFNILVSMLLLLDLHGQNPPHVLHVPELTVFIWALTGLSSNIPTARQLAGSCPWTIWGGDFGLIQWFISELIVSFL